MKTLDILGLDPKATNSTINELQQLLADFHVFYMNVRGFHWNVEGKNFFKLHALFEEIYSEVAEQIDEVAERILTLGGVPENKFSKFLQTAKVKEIGETNSGKATVEAVLNDLKTIIAQERKVSDVASDDVTEDLITGFLGGQEKRVWMLVSFLQEGK